MTAHDAVLIGAGQRGRYVYGEYALRHPKRLRFVSVVDPDPRRRDIFGDTHEIPRPRRYADWSAAFEASSATGIAVIASPDRHHADPAVAALDLGLDVLLEKPIAHSLEETRRVLGAARHSSGNLHIAHVLRYTPFFTTLNEVVTSGRLGDLIHVEHRENVVYWHMAHSFVRGSWANADASTPMIVQKCCHDFDVLAWNIDARVSRMHSFGSLMHFHPGNAPPGATARCTDPCPAASLCPFDATRIYLDERRTGWPVHVITDDLTTEGRLEALRTGPYGRCVYTAGSDVVDHQIVSMELESGATASLSVHGHSHRENRTMRYDGSRGTVRAVFGSTTAIEFTDHRDGATESISVEAVHDGHGGGDEGLIDAFLQSVETGRESRTSGADAYESHLLAFSAEEARCERSTIDVTARRASWTPT